MKKTAKIISMLAAVMIAIGILLVAAGYISGAERGVYINNKGINILKNREDYSYENMNLTGIKNISIDMTNAEVVIRRSDNNKYGIAINLNSAEAKPQVLVENGTVSVKNEGAFHWFMFDFDFWNLFKNGENKIIVYVPDLAELDKLEVDISNAVVNLETLLTVKELDIDTSNAKINLNQIVCNGDAVVKTSNGAIECDGKFLGNARFKTSNGIVKLKGSYKNTEVKTSNGKIEAEFLGSETDYNLEADTSNGVIKVDGKKVSDNGEEYENTHAGAKSNVNLKTSNGSIDITFKK